MIVQHTIHAAQASLLRGYNRSVPPRGTPGFDRRPQQCPERKNCQCKACGVHGHEHTDCNLLPCVISCLKYRDSQPTQCKDAVRRSLARNTTQSYEQNVRETEKMVKACLTSGMAIDLINNFVDAALGQQVYWTTPL